MAKHVYTFSQQSAHRIASAVRRVEGMPLDLRSRPNPPRIAGGGSLPGAFLAVVREVHSSGDYLICNRWAPEPVPPADPIEAEDILVFRAFGLINRLAPAGPIGAEYTYTDAQTRTSVVSGKEDETQKVTPEYFVDEMVIVGAAPAGLLAYYSEIVPPNPNDELVFVGMEVNTLGRAWAAVVEGANDAEEED